jgi:hypothetical protein
MRDSPLQWRSIYRLLQKLEVPNRYVDIFCGKVPRNVLARLQLREIEVNL